MARIALLTLAALMFALTVSAQQNPPASPSNPAGMLTVDQQMAVLTQKLDLTTDQQAKIRPIMQDLHDFTEKIAADDTLSRDEKLGKIRPERVKAGQKVRAFLSDEQKQKLEAYVHGPHPEMHGNLSGSNPPPQHL